MHNPRPYLWARALVTGLLLPTLPTACSGGAELEDETRAVPTPGAASAGGVGGDSDTCASDTDETEGDGDGSETDAPADDTTPGEAEAVAEARERFPNFLDLHTKVIKRTCTPDEGVCHNQKEYPDLRTPESMLAIVGAPCNEDVEDPLAVFGGCEPAADELEIVGGTNDGFRAPIGYIDVDEEGLSAVVHLREGPPENPTFGGDDVRIIRTIGAQELPVLEFSAELAFDAGSPDLILDLTSAEIAPASLTADVIVGDPNRDGVFGAEDSFALVDSGRPERSYLLQRLLGAVPGSAMPLANTPLDGSEIVAISCWIESLALPENIDVSAPIDYDDCVTAAAFGAPDPLSGHSLSADVQPIFEARCVQCHAGPDAAEGLDLGPGRARASLLQESEQSPPTRRVEPGNPTNSYLITKLTGAGASGEQMPLGGEISAAEEQTIRAWIIAGAPDD